MDSDQWNETLETEYDDIEEKLIALNDKRDEYAQYSDEEKSYSGCIVYINTMGEIAVQKGLAKPADIKKKSAEVKTRETEIAQAEISPESVAYPQALQHDLALYKQQIIKSKIAQNADFAADLLIFTLCRELFLSGWQSQPLAITANLPTTKTKLDDLHTTVAGEAMAKIYKDMDLSFLQMDSCTASFVAFRALSKSMKETLFAFISASLFSLSPVFDDAFLNENLDIDYPANWRPTGENFFSRLNKGALLNLGQDWFGDQWVTDNEKRKKSELVEIHNGNFGGTTSLDNERAFCAIRKSWLPDGFNA